LHAPKNLKFKIFRSKLWDPIWDFWISWSKIF